MQPFQCDLQPQIPKHPITTHTQAQPKQLEATVTMRPKKKQTDRSRARRTQEVPFIAACSHFTRKNTRFRAPASCPNTKPMQHSCSHSIRSATSPLPVLTTSLRHHFPSSPLPFIAFYSFVMYCDTEPPFIDLFFCDLFVMYCHHFTTLHQCQVSQFYLSVTRKIASQLPLIE